MAAKSTAIKSAKGKKSVKPAKKAAKKKVASPKKPAAPKKPDVELEAKNLDRKGLAAHTRQIKKELLAIRFNLQAPSLKEYRRKKTELQKYLAQFN